MLLANGEDDLGPDVDRAIGHEVAYAPRRGLLDESVHVSGRRSRLILEIDRSCDGLVSRDGGGHELRREEECAVHEDAGGEGELRPRGHVGEEPRNGHVEVVRVFGAQEREQLAQRRAVRAHGKQREPSPEGHRR
jgi:hypothetical protein